MIHRVKGFRVVREAGVQMFFWDSLAFCMIQLMLATWSLVPLPFLNPVCTSGSFQFSSVTQLCSIPCEPMDCSMPGLPVHTNCWSLLKLMSIGLVMPSNHLILCRPLLLLPSIFPSIRFFPTESVLRIMWPKYWSFSFSINPSNEYSGLISFRMDWLDPLDVQETLKSLLQHHSSKAPILQCSGFFIVQLPHPYVTTWENHRFD